MPQEYKGAKDFRDLEVWQHCRDLRRDVEAYAKTLPREEQFRLKDQMVRASRSVTANFAEGFGRYHYKESIRHMRMARGSLYELLDHLVVAVDNKYMESHDFTAYEQRIESGLKLLNGYVRYLRTRNETAGTTQSTGEPVSR